MLKHFTSFATPHQTQRELVTPPGMIPTDSPCSQTSSHYPKLVWMCSEPSTSPAISNSSCLLPAAAEQLMLASLWCALVQTEWCPQASQNPLFPLPFGYCCCTWLPNSCLQMFLLGSIYCTGKWQNLRQKTLQFCYKKLSKEVQEWSKWKIEKPERAMKTYMLLYIDATQFPCKHLFPACKAQHRQWLLQQFPNPTFVLVQSAAPPVSHANPLKPPAAWKHIEKVVNILVSDFMFRNQKGK